MGFASCPPGGRTWTIHWKPSPVNYLIILRAGPSIFQKRAEPSGPRRVPQLAQRLGLDLTDALAGDRERMSNLFEGVFGTVFHAKPHPNDLLLARGQRL